MLAVLKSILIGYFVLSTVLSLIAASKRLLDEYHFIFGTGIFIAVLSLSYLIGKSLQ